MNTQSRKWYSRELTQKEYDTMLHDNLVGTLSLSDGTRPYAIQLEYLFHDRNLYMATSVEGRKIDYLKKNDRAVFTIFKDRFSHPEMIEQNIRCRSIMAEGKVETLFIKNVRTPKGDTYPFRLLKFTVEKWGSWQCNRKTCNLATGIDTRKIILDWLKEAAHTKQAADKEKNQ